MNGWRRNDGRDATPKARRSTNLDEFDLSCLSADSEEFTGALALQKIDDTSALLVLNADLLSELLINFNLCIFKIGIVTKLSSKGRKKLRGTMI